MNAKKAAATVAVIAGVGAAVALNQPGPRENAREQRTAFVQRCLDAKRDAFLLGAAEINKLREENDALRSEMGKLKAKVRELSECELDSDRFYRIEKELREMVK